MITVALIDDHTLFRTLLAAHINSTGCYRVVLEAANGKSFIQQLDPKQVPQLVLLDIQMPEMNGYDTAAWIHAHHPNIQVLVVTMQHDASAVMTMLQHGAKGFVVKSAELEELTVAMDAVMNKGIHFNRILYKSLQQIVATNAEEEQAVYYKTPKLSRREKEFLQWLCTDKAYKEIAASMKVSPRTVDGYRDSLLMKLKVTSRVGLVTFAIRNRIVISSALEDLPNLPSS